MSRIEGPVRVGVLWDELERNREQLQRIEEFCGVEPVIWKDGTPAPDVDVLMAGVVPEWSPGEMAHLRLVQLASAGTDWLLQHPLWASDIPIATASGVHSVQIPEHVFMLLLALYRHVPQYLAAQRRHVWRHDGINDDGVPIEPKELRGSTLGLVGYGHIGRGVAHLARAFGMRVLATSATTRETRPLSFTSVAPFEDVPAVPRIEGESDEIWPLSRLDDLLSEADAVVVSAPLTPQTERLLDAARLRRMKQGAYLINIGRGKIVDEEALVRVLRDGHLGGAGLDVTAEEPLPVDSPLWEMPNVIVTPHVSGRSERYVERTVNILLANVERLREGEAPLTAVDRQRGY